MSLILNILIDGVAYGMILFMISVGLSVGISAPPCRTLATSWLHLHRRQ